IPGIVSIREARHDARKKFLSDTAKNVVYPNIKALVERGVRYIQIDEPAATTKRDEIPEFIETLQQSIGDMAKKSFFTLHICFSDYSRLFPAILNLQGTLDEVHFEYANRDSHELGTEPGNRIGYEILKKFKGTDFKIGLGVL